MLTVNLNTRPSLCHLSIDRDVWLYKNTFWLVDWDYNAFKYHWTAESKARFPLPKFTARELGCIFWHPSTFSYPLHLTPPYGVAPGTIAVNVTRLERGFNACKTPRCIYRSIFNRFPVIQAWSLKIRHFSTFLHILASPVWTRVVETGLNRLLLTCWIPDKILPDNRHVARLRRLWRPKIVRPTDQRILNYSFRSRAVSPFWECV